MLRSCIGAARLHDPVIVESRESDAGSRAASTRGRRRAHSSGFTLIETLIATVLFIGVSAMIVAILQSLDHSVTNSQAALQSHGSALDASVRLNNSLSDATAILTATASQLETLDAIGGVCYDEFWQASGTTLTEQYTALGTAPCPASFSGVRNTGVRVTSGLTSTSVFSYSDASGASLGAAPTPALVTRVDYVLSVKQTGQTGTTTLSGSDTVGP